MLLARHWMLSVVVALVLWPAVALGQSPELMAAHKRHADLYAQGHYQEALPFAEQALSLGEHEFGSEHPNTATLLNELALIYRALGRYTAAEPLNKRALAIYEKTLGPKHRHVATSLSNLAALYVDQGRYAEAVPLYQRAFLIAQRALGPDHAQVADIRSSLGALVEVLGGPEVLRGQSQTLAFPAYKESPAYEEMEIQFGDAARELLAVPIPSGWEVGATELYNSEDEFATGGVVNIEIDKKYYIPSEQTMDNWSELINVEHFRRKLRYLSPYSIYAGVTSRVMKNCEFGRGPEPTSRQQKGHLTTEGFYACTKDILTERGMFVMSKVIETKNSQYVVQRIWRGMPFSPKEIPRVVESFDGWSAWVGRVTVRSSLGTDKLEKHGSATGFAVSREGHVMTNLHVVKDCREVRVASLNARIAASDTENDLALLVVSHDFASAASFREGRAIRPGDTVVVAGFPLQGLLTSDLSVTTGTLSALAGPGDDSRLMQITAPVQPGNSGGPLIDLAGNVVGVVVGKLDALKVARLTGDIPQNVNFSIKAAVARAFLDAHDVPYETASSKPTLSPADVAAKAQEFTVAVECWR